MNIAIIHHGSAKIAEIEGQDKEIKSTEDITALMDQAVSQQADKLLARRKLIDESFFDLKSGFAGKLTDRLKEKKLKLAVVGEFNFIENIALKAYIKDKKLGDMVMISRNREEALDWLSRA